MSNIKKLTLFVISICLLPIVFNWIGLHFETGGASFSAAFKTIPSPEQPENNEAVTVAIFATQVISGSFIHTILEWTAVSMALFIVSLAFIQFYMKREPTTPIIGVALFCAGLTDAFHVLASDRLISAASPNELFIPFTWVISRLSNSVILFIGVLLLLSRKDINQQHGLRYVLIVSATLTTLVLAVVFISTQVPLLPKTSYAANPIWGFITRPYDLLPLLIFFVSGVWLFPKFYRHHPGIFAQTLILSMIPQIMAQLHMVFGARILFDNHFNIAHFLKVIAYSVPLIGLTLEYIQTFIDEKLSRVGLEKARNELREANATLEIKVEERTTALAQANAEMLDDLKQGGVVQRGLMEVVATPDYQVDAVNRPYKGWVGGDGYSLLKSTNGDYWLRVSDGTGHGSSGGEAEIVDHLLFSNVIEQAHNSAEALNMMTTILHERFPNANLTYAYFLAHLTPTGRVDYVNARQLAFHIKKNKVEQLPSVPVIVGEIGDIEITKHQTLMLEADESLLIATDGIFEARYWNERNQKNSIVGKRAIKVRAHLSTQDIYKDITSFPNFVQADDILIVKLSKSSAAVEHSLRLMRDMSDEELETLQNSEITSQSWRKTQKAFLLKENNNTEAYYFADLGTETRDFLRKLLEYSEASKRLVRQTQGVISELLLNAQTHMEKPSYLCFTLAFRHDGSILLILVNSSSEENFEKARTYVLEALDAKAAGKTKLDELADKLLEQTSEGGIGLWNAVTQLNGDFWVTFDRKNSYLTSYCIIREK